MMCIYILISISYHINIISYIMQHIMWYIIQCIISCITSRKYVCIIVYVSIYIYRYIHIIWTCHTDTEYIVVCSYVQYLYIYTHMYTSYNTHKYILYSAGTLWIHIYIDLHILECVYNVYIYVLQVTTNQLNIRFLFGASGSQFAFGCQVRIAKRSAP